MEKPMEVHVRLSADDVEVLDEARGSMTRSAFIRSLVRRSAAGERSTGADRGEAIEILSEMARSGKVAAAVALERALRDEMPTGDEVPPWRR